ncbi:MAG: cupin domain-containing protein [Candidatus Shapirobacteria bacterium]
MSGFYAKIEKDTLENTNFRQVLFTGKHAQLVLMSIKAGEDIGSEVHDHVDQFFRFEAGKGKVIIDGQEYEVKDGDAVIVPAGSGHNVINTGTENLQLYTVYSPPNHPDGTIHATRADAMAAEEEEHDH